MNETQQNQDDMKIKELEKIRDELLQKINMLCDEAEQELKAINGG